MIRRAYIFLGLAAAPFAIIGLRIYTKMTKRPRVRVLVTNERGEVLLLRGILSRGRWTLPGGGVGRRESHAAAARRELHEETGIDVGEDSLEFVRLLTKKDIKIPFTIPLYRVTVEHSDLPKKPVNRLEIRDVAWFGRDKLPVSLSSIAKTALQERQYTFK